MKIGAPKETFEAEARVAMTPDSALQLQKIGHTCFIESGAGLAAGFFDTAYEAAGVTLVNTAADLFEQVDVVVKVRPPSTTEAGQLRNAQTLISFSIPPRARISWSSVGTKVQPSSRWTWCPVSRGLRRWMRCRRWRTLPAIAR